MSLIPMFFDDFMRPRSIFDQNFGMGLLDEDMVFPFSAMMPTRSGYCRPWRLLSRQQSGVSNIVNDKDKFQVNLDVQQFKPEEITVKAVDNTIVVEGKHEEKQDEHGFVSRQFSRRYVLPEGADKDKIECKLSSDGVLCVSCPKLVSYINVVNLQI
jgi:crystallin, alpha B